MCSIDLDPASLWSEREVRARKRHTCDCCGGFIQPGAVYVKHFSMLIRLSPTGERKCSDS